MYFELGVLLGKAVLKLNLMKISAHEQKISLLQLVPDTSPFLRDLFGKHHTRLTNTVTRFLLVPLDKMIYFFFPSCIRQ